MDRNEEIQIKCEFANFVANFLHRQGKIALEILNTSFKMTFFWVKVANHSFVNFRYFDIIHNQKIVGLKMHYSVNFFDTLALGEGITSLSKSVAPSLRDTTTTNTTNIIHNFILKLLDQNCSFIGIFWAFIVGTAKMKFVAIQRKFAKLTNK
jgi:hypothetical protein